MSKVEKLKNVCTKIKERYIQLCKYLDDSFQGKADGIMINWFAILFIICFILFPNSLNEDYLGNLALTIIEEIFYSLFLVFIFSCTVFFHRTKVTLWIGDVLLLLRYLTLIGSGTDWNRQLNYIYLAIVVVYFVSLTSFNSAKQINNKGGKIDTIVLAIGMTCLLLGLYMRSYEINYHKYIILFGVILIYLYAISRALFWILFAKEKVKFNLIKTMGCVVLFVILIIAVPFVLEYAGVSSETIREIIVPIYAAVVGGVLTLGGVAWTIKKSDADKKETNRRLATPFFGVVDGTSLDTIVANKNFKQFVKPDRGDCDRKFVCNLVNSDKNIYYIDKIQINGEDYFSDSKVLIKKDEIFSVWIMDKKDIHIQRQTIRMFITDMNYEQRIFDVVYGENGEYNQIVEVNQ